VIDADVRVVAATNRDPAEAISSGKLREDLYYRLNVFNIIVPPLRERPEDIPLLARHLAEQYAESEGTPVPEFDPAVLQALVAHRWPGNVRELKNAIERATLLSQGGQVLLEHLPPEVAAASADSEAPVPVPAESAEPAPAVVLRVGATMEETEREMIRSTLKHTVGNKTRAAKILNISLKTMHNKVKKYEL